TLGPGAITYQLRRLRLHGVIERLPNSLLLPRHPNRVPRCSVLHPHLQPPPPAKPRRRPPRALHSTNPTHPSLRPPRRAHHRGDGRTCLGAVKLDTFSTSVPTLAELVCRPTNSTQ